MRKFVFELKPFPTPRHLPKPIMQLIFSNPNDSTKELKIIGLVDTGADYCTVPLKLQKELGLDLEKIGAERSRITCACGKKDFMGYRYKLNVTTFDINNKPLTRLLWVHFAESDTIPLIGRNFMNIFKKITYNNDKSKGFFINPKEEDDNNN